MQQKGLVQRSLFNQSFISDEAKTKDVVDAVLEEDIQLHDGKVFHQSQTPRNSVRRTLTEMQAQGLVIKEGRGTLRFDIGKIRGCVIKGDVEEMLSMCPDNSIPIIHADPAWSYLNAHLAKGSNTRMMGAANNFYHTGDLPESTIKEIHRTLKPGGVFLCWFPPIQDEGQDVRIDTQVMLRKAGLSQMRGITWCKGKGGGYGYAPSSEECQVWYKDIRPTVSNGGLFDLSVTNVIVHPRMNVAHKTIYTDYDEASEAEWARLKQEFGSNKKIPRHMIEGLPTKCHQAEKPVAVLKDILRVIIGAPDCKRGQANPDRNLVVDLYSGTAAACQAAHELGGEFIAVELDQRNVQHMIRPRLEKITSHDIPVISIMEEATA